MAQEEEQKKTSIVKTTSIVAAGCASVVAALFTSRLGVAGTLVGTAMTSMVITLTSAVLNAQLERASTKISGLPSTVRGRLSTQQVRIPGRTDGGSAGGGGPNPEPPAEEPRAEQTRRSERRGEGSSAGFLERLRSVPARLRAMSPTTRRRVLVSGALAGVAATAIGLVIITATEAASGQNLSSLVWSQGGAASAETPSSRSSVLSVLGDPASTGPANQQYTPSGGGQPTPGGGEQQTPGGAGGGQYEQPGGGGQPQQQPQNPAQPAPGGQQQQPPPSGQYDQ